MANYATLKSAIQAVIKTNGNNEITGLILQQAIISLINSLGSDFQLVGGANVNTNPGTPDQNVAYLAGSGTYPNFNNLVVPDGYLGVLKYNGSWSLETIQVGKNYDNIIAQLSNVVNGVNLTSTDVANGNSAGYTLVDYRLSNSGTWMSPGKTVFFPVADIIDQLQIVPTSSQVSYKYALVKSTTVVSGQMADYCSGETVHIVTGVETILKKTNLPPDCVYIAVVYKQTANDPYAVSYVLANQSIREELEKTNNNVDALNDKFGFSVTGAEILANTDGNFIVVNGKRITGAGKWGNAGIAYFYPVTKNTEKIEIVPDSSVSDTYKYAFLKTIGSYVSGVSPDFCSGETNAYEIQNNITTVINKNDIPADCKYIYISIQQYVAETIVAKLIVNLEAKLNQIDDDIYKINEQLAELYGTELTSSELISNPGGIYDVVDGVRISDAGVWV